MADVTLPRSVLLIGTAGSCAQLAEQLSLLETPPQILGDVHTDDRAAMARLEDTLVELKPDAALISLPAALAAQVTTIRTRLRRAGVPDRFMPLLEDQLLGVGPRSQFEVDVAALIDRPPREIDEGSIHDLIAGRCVLITGAGGSIGSELARCVASFGPSRLVMIERSENALFEIDRQIARACPGLDRRAVLHDVVDAAGTLTHCRDHRPAVIFHAAAHKHVPMMEDHPGAAVENNLFGTKAIADAAHHCGAERFVMISTDKAVNPSSIMGATKRLAELYVQHRRRESDTRFSMVRFGNVLGSSGSVLTIWGRQLRDGGPLTVTHRDMTRYFMTIPEAAALVIQSAVLIDPAGDAGEVFLLDMGEPVKIADLAARFVEAHGLTPVFVEGEATAGESRAADPSVMRIVVTGPRPGEKLHEVLAFDAEAMQRTRHPDINIWKLPTPDPRYIEEMTSSLSPMRRPRTARELAAEIRRLLPEMVEPVVASG